MGCALSAEKDGEGERFLVMTLFLLYLSEVFFFCIYFDTSKRTKRCYLCEKEYLFARSYVFFVLTKFNFFNKI